MRALLLALLLLGAGRAQAADIHVMISGGFTAAYEALRPGFERSSGHKLVTVRGASMGTAPTALPMRLRQGEPADVLIMVGDALAALQTEGRVVANSRVDLANSAIGMAVRAGAARPDIGSVDSLRQTLLAARSVGYSVSASGQYISGQLFQRLGIAEQMQGRGKLVLGEPVAAQVARGEIELGFQQMSELLPVPGITIVGPLPAAMQHYTVFSGGVASAARQPEAAAALLRYLAGPAAREAITASGLQPWGSGN